MTMGYVFVSREEGEKYMSQCGIAVHGRHSELGWVMVKRIKEKARDAAFKLGLDPRAIKVLDVCKQDDGITGRWRA